MLVCKGRFDDYTMFMIFLSDDYPKYYTSYHQIYVPPNTVTEKNGFVTATKLGTTNNFLLLQPKILLHQPNVFLIELNILLL